MTSNPHRHDDAEAYERFMGRWSRAAGVVFLDWVAPPTNARWLDVGCGTGAFTELVLNGFSPAEIVGVDPSPEQINHVNKSPIGEHADFRVADALALPFPNGDFDVVASALAINFIPDCSRAIAEMHRVVRPGGTVAAYVWDLIGEGAPNGPIRLGMQRLAIAAPPAIGSEESRREALQLLFAAAGFRDIETRAIDIAVEFRDFDDFWESQTPTYNSIGKLIARLADTDRTRLMNTVRASLPPRSDGTIVYSARANAVKARA